MRSMWSVGFAACIFIEDPIYFGAPRVLSLEDVNVKYFKDEFGTTKFRYFKRMQASDMSGIHRITSIGFEEEILNIKTFVLDAPTSSGALRSKMSMLLQDYKLEYHLLQCSVTAERARASPVIVTEMVEQKNNPYSIPTAALTGELIKYLIDLMRFN